MKPLQPQHFMGRAKKLVPSRENAERIRAVGIMLEDEGDDFGLFLQQHADNMLELRQNAFGGRLNVNGSGRYWDAE